MQTISERDIFGKALPVVLGLTVLIYLHRQRIVRLLDAPALPVAE